MSNSTSTISSITWTAHKLYLYRPEADDKMAAIFCTSKKLTFSEHTKILVSTENKTKLTQLHVCVCVFYHKIQFVCKRLSGVVIDQSKKSWKMGSRPGSPRWQSAPEPPGCFIWEDLQTLHISTNKELEVWAQYRLLFSFLGRHVRGSGKKSWNGATLRQHTHTQHTRVQKHILFNNSFKILIYS